MVYQVDLTGSISEADAETLARAASERCFVENTIARSLPITTEVNLNGKKSYRLPETAKSNQLRAKMSFAT